MDAEMESSNLCIYPEGDFKLTNPRARGCFNKGLFCGFWLDRFLSAWWLHHTVISHKWRHRCHVLITPNPLTSPTYYHNKFGPRSCTLFQRFFFSDLQKESFYHIYPWHIFKEVLETCHNWISPRRSHWIYLIGTWIVLKSLIITDVKVYGTPDHTLPNDDGSFKILRTFCLKDNIVSRLRKCYVSKSNKQTPILISSAVLRKSWSWRVNALARFPIDRPKI